MFWFDFVVNYQKYNARLFKRISIIFIKFIVYYFYLKKIHFLIHKLMFSLSKILCFSMKFTIQYKHVSCLYRCYYSFYTIPKIYYFGIRPLHNSKKKKQSHFNDTFSQQNTNVQKVHRPNKVHLKDKASPRRWASGRRRLLPLINFL